MKNFIPKFQRTYYPEPVPYFYKNLKSKLSKSTKQIYKMYTYFNRTGFALLEYNFTFNFCRVDIEKFGIKVTLRNRTHMLREQAR